MVLDEAGKAKKKGRERLSGVAKVLLLNDHLGRKHFKTNDYMIIYRAAMDCKGLLPRSEEVDLGGAMNRNESTLPYLHGIRHRICVGFATPSACYRPPTSKLPKVVRRGRKRCCNQLEKWSPKSLLHQCNPLLVHIRQNTF